MKPVRIVVIDSGIDITYNMGNVALDEGVCISLIDDKICYTKKLYDNVGHGTGVMSMIHKTSADIVAIPLKVMDDTLCTAECLYEALNYIYSHIKCDMIHISLGVTCCTNRNKLYDICKRLDQKGVIIVSALDNHGLISYPAGFDCVIGIDSSNKWRDFYDYTVVENSEINIVGYRLEQRVAWKGNTTQMVSGTSFTAAFFSGQIACIIMERGKLNRRQILNILSERAKRIVKVNDITILKPEFTSKKAVVFPFNKEIHSLVRFRCMLNIKDINFYDVKYTGQVGKEVSNWAWNAEGVSDRIQNIETLDWKGDFDTFILGHIHEIETIINKTYVEKIIENCVKYNKKLYSFFNIEERIPDELKDRLIYYYPQIKPIRYNEVSFKMYEIDTPVLSIVGTHSRQGKFTVQLALRNALQEAGYRVGQLGTEPSALLFDMDAVYPMGYEGSVYVSGPDAVYTINRMMGIIQNKCPDIIITGAQGNVHTIYPSGYNACTTAVHEFLLGCQADAYILCISYGDELDDIRNTINYLESLYSASVIAMVLSPKASNMKWSIINSTANRVDPSKLKNYQQKVSNFFSIPVFILNHQNDIKPLMDLCIDYFS
jgi:hypothetical protein